MKITAIKRLRVALVPSWLDELVSASPDLSYKDLLCFSTLLESKGSILSEEQVIIYALTQNYINGFTDRAFEDLPSIATTDGNALFLSDRGKKVEKVRISVNVTDALAEKSESSLSFTPTGLMAKEYYLPLPIDSDTLLLIGSRVPVFQDERAFYNALLESIGDKLEYAEFKQYEFFKRYLRVAVSG